MPTMAIKYRGSVLNRMLQAYRLLYLSGDKNALELRSNHE